MKPIRNFVRKQLRSSWAEYVRVYLRSMNRQPPILVYQVGRVGSQTVYRSLKASGLPNPIYHVHWLSQEGMRNVEERYRGTGVLPPHLITSRMLRRKLNEGLESPWFLITLVRDPIAREVSEFFELLGVFHPELVAEDGRLQTDRAIEILEAKFGGFDEASDKTCTWFDRELKAVFGIDLYAHPFDRQEGYAVLCEGQVKVLALRLEDLDGNAPAIGQFLGIRKPFRLVRSNEATGKAHGRDYGRVVEDLRVPEAVCARIYASRYARHFYEPSMLVEFTEKWSAGERQAHLASLEEGSDER